MRIRNMVKLIGHINTYTLLDETTRGYTSFIFELGVNRPLYHTQETPITDYIPVHAYNKTAKKARSIVRKGRLVCCVGHIVVVNQTQSPDLRLILDDIEALES